MSAVEFKKITIFQLKLRNWIVENYKPTNADWRARELIDKAIKEVQNEM